MITWIITVPQTDGSSYVTSVSRAEQINPIASASASDGDVIIDEWHQSAAYTDGPILGWRYHRRYVWQ